ncbi:LRR receptor-like serine/threonine-protein kinase ERECTA [Camellia lanceoleosa]|nr:LRR receptor-like serine/threonine-protein kinase ERECTA [Camellia lanceoleosa]
MCQLTGLWHFDVRNNSLIGSIPQNIGNCTAFQVLDLSYNQLTGDIPFNIGFLQVATLSLQGNQLSGQIPSVIRLMQALAVLDLSCNMLSRPIPHILGNLTYMEKLKAMSLKSLFHVNAHNRLEALLFGTFMEDETRSWLKQSYEKTENHVEKNEKHVEKKELEVGSSNVGTGLSFG